MNDNAEKIITVAYLHDVLEDTSVTEEELLSIFPAEVVTAVKAITKGKDEPYTDYLKRVRANKFSTIVKLCDLANNSDISRIERELTSRELKRLEKYRKAIEYLNEEK